MHRIQVVLEGILDACKQIRKLSMNSRYESNGPKLVEAAGEAVAADLANHKLGDRLEQMLHHADGDVVIKVNAVINAMSSMS